MIILRQLRRHKGVFCRTCGLAVGRQAQNATLSMGWWGIIAFFWNLVLIARNASGLRYHAKMTPPPRSPLQLSAEPSVWRRGGIAVAGLVAVLVVTGGGYLISKSSREAALVDLQVGQCVAFSADETQITGLLNCSSTHGGKVVAATADGACPTNDMTFMLTNSNGSPSTSSAITCVDRTQ